MSRSNRYVSGLARRSAPRSADSITVGGRSASVTRTPGMRSSRMPPAPSDARRGPRTPDSRTVSEDVSRSRTGSRFQPRWTANRRPPISTSCTTPRLSEYGMRSTYGTSRRPVKATVRAWRDGTSARSASHAVAGSPSSAAAGRRSGNCVVCGEASARHGPHAADERDGLGRLVRPERVEERAVDARPAVGGEDRAAAAARVRGRERAAAVLVGDHERRPVRAAARSAAAGPRSGA